MDLKICLEKPHMLQGFEMDFQNATSNLHTLLCNLPIPCTEDFFAPLHIIGRYS